jgi:AraC-like DNA-binding protein
VQDVRDSRGMSRRQTDNDKGLVRLGPLTGVVPVTRELGIDPEEILEPLGFTTAQFDDPDLEIPYVTAGRLLARCAQATQCPHFGLLVGIRARPSTLGLPGFLLLNAPDVGAALDALVQNLDLHDQGGVPLLDRQGKSTLLGYTIHQVRVEASEQIYDIAIAIGCNIMRHLCGGSWNPTEVWLSRNSPSELKPHRQFFRAPVRFNRDRNALRFPSHWLNHKISSADALLYRHFAREANALHRLRQADIIQDTRRLLRISLMNGHCTVNVIARQLCMHERTLHRRLREEGTCFQQELNTVRDGVARKLLAGSDMPIVRIAATLNYSSVSAFNRAFKRWNGSTPARWRASNTTSS